MKLRLELTHPCEQVLCVCVPGVETEVVIRDGGRAQSVPASFAIREAFGRCNVVPDVDRYRLHMEDGRIALHPHSQCRVAWCSNRYYDHDPIAAGVEGKTIVIVLESPHKDEYLRNVGQPIAPAQGATGSNIQGYLDEVLHSCHALCDELTAGTRVLLSNPVQFQASLISIIDYSKLDKPKQDPTWKKIRDAVWKALWHLQPVQDDFKDRFENYRPDFIVNACTHDLGCDYKCLTATSSGCRKRKVHDFLLGAFSSAHIYSANHPSSWHRDRNRTLSQFHQR